VYDHLQADQEGNLISPTTNFAQKEHNLDTARIMSLLQPITLFLPLHAQMYRHNTSKREYLDMEKLYL
jgi:hypothetical protein